MKSVFADVVCLQGALCSPSVDFWWLLAFVSTGPSETDKLMYFACFCCRVCHLFGLAATCSSCNYFKQQTVTSLNKLQCPVGISRELRGFIRVSNPGKMPDSETRSWTKIYQHSSNGMRHSWRHARPPSARPSRTCSSTSMHSFNRCAD